jgi:hypothetical protein
LFQTANRRFIVLRDPVFLDDATMDNPETLRAPTPRPNGYRTRTEVVRDGSIVKGAPRVGSNSPE